MLILHSKRAHVSQRNRSYGCAEVPIRTFSISEARMADVGRWIDIRLTGHGKALAPQTYPHLQCQCGVQRSDVYLSSYLIPPI